MCKFHESDDKNLEFCYGITCSDLGYYYINWFKNLFFSLRTQGYIK